MSPAAPPLAGSFHGPPNGGLGIRTTAVVKVFFAHRSRDNHKNWILLFKPMVCAINSPWRIHLSCSLCNRGIVMSLSSRKRRSMDAHSHGYPRIPSPWSWQSPLDSYKYYASYVVVPTSLPPSKHTLNPILSLSNLRLQ